MKVKKKFEYEGNPIKGNRIVSHYTFAVCLKSFIEDVQINDPCSEEDKEALLIVANKLLTYQRQTATDKEEIEYLKRVNEWDLEPIIKTEDGVSIYRENILLYSCMRNPQKGEQMIVFVSGKLKDRVINKNRLFFAVEAECENYIKSNCKKYSVKDIESAFKDNKLTAHFTDLDYFFSKLDSN